MRAEPKLQEFLVEKMLVYTTKTEDNLRVFWQSTVDANIDSVSFLKIRFILVCMKTKPFIIKKI